MRNHAQPQNQRILRNGQAPGNNQAQNNAAPNGEIPRVKPLHDTFTVQGGTITALESKFVHTKEAVEVISRVFPHLTLGRKEDRPRFRVDTGENYGYLVHEHALSRDLRHIFAGYIHSCEIPKHRFLDIGASVIRNIGTIVENESILYKRGWQMTPILDARDQMRADDHVKRIEQIAQDHIKRRNDIDDPNVAQHDRDFDESLTRCTHAGGAVPVPGRIGVSTPRDTVCFCNQNNFEAITTIDSAYYPGVLEEMRMHMTRRMSTNQIAHGHVVFHDYHEAALSAIRNASRLELAMMIKDDTIELRTLNNRNGHTEMIAEIAVSTSMVKVTVAGNPTPYRHNIIETNGPIYITQDMVNINTVDYNPVFHYTQELTAWNGQVPYKYYKVRVTPKGQWTQEMLGDVKHVNGDFIAPNYYQEIIASRYVELTDLEVALQSIPQETPEPERIEEKIDPNFFDHKGYSNKLSQRKDLKLNTVDRKKRVDAEISFFKFIQDQFRGRGFKKFNIRYVDGEAWIYIISLNNQFKWHEIKSYIGLTYEDRDRSFRAKLKDVIEAYLKIGVKQSQTSVMYAMTQQQREKVADECQFDAIDAFVIARYIRMCEETRYDRFMNA
jgi:hypothetical protein